MVPTYLFILFQFILFIPPQNVFTSFSLTIIYEFAYSLNQFLCLHLAINSHRWYNNFSGYGYSIICIFSSRHRLHLLSKYFGVFDFFNIDHWITGVKPLFFKLQKCLDMAVWFFRCAWVKENLWFVYLDIHLMDEIHI